MAELGLVAQAAIRSTCSLLRTTPIRSHSGRNLARISLIPASLSGSHYMSTSSNLRSAHSPVRPTHNSLPSRSTSLSRIQQQSYSSNDWVNNGRETRGNLSNISQINIQKPNISSYKFSRGDQNGDDTNNEMDNEDSAADDYKLDIGDIGQISPKGRPQVELGFAVRTPIRMVPRTGRTVHVKNNVDVARSFKLLATQVSQNRLRQSFYSQRFHERPGMKRKRLKSERWQKRFKRGFKATVARVRELTAQGW
ncbi:hypothetical protein GGS21DRAFT_243606 [Xylaria nigripes]|nr:hypothetical protein GGS21DRAFT_243606 [Xylaria nigripes]